MRIRSIKPDFFKDEIIAELRHVERLTFIGLWLIADRNGRLEYRPKYIKAELFPYEEKLDMEKILKNLELTGIIRYFTVKERLFIDIPNFLKHQKPHNTEKDKGFPSFEESDNGYITVTPPLDNGAKPTNHDPRSMIHDPLNNDPRSKKEARKKKKLEPLYPDIFEEVGKLWRAAHGSPNFNRLATIKWWNHWVGWANGLCNGIQEIDGMRAHHVEKQMLKATKLYLARCLANKITIKNSSTFFGPEGHWKDELDREDQVKQGQAARRQQQQPADTPLDTTGMPDELKKKLKNLKEMP